MSHKLSKRQQRIRAAQTWQVVYRRPGADPQVWLRWATWGEAERFAASIGRQLVEGRLDPEYVETG